MKITDSPPIMTVEQRGRSKAKVAVVNYWSLKDIWDAKVSAETRYRVGRLPVTEYIDRAVTRPMTPGADKGLIVFCDILPQLHDCCRSGDMIYSDGARS